MPFTLYMFIYVSMPYIYIYMAMQTEQLLVVE